MHKLQITIPKMLSMIQIYFHLGVQDKIRIMGLGEGLNQGLSQDFKTGYPKLAIANFFKGDHNILE